MWFYRIGRSNRFNAPILEESHSKTLALALALVLVLTLLQTLTLRMIKVTKIKNIMQEVLREHHKLFAIIGQSVKALITSVQPLSTQQLI